MTEFVNYRRRHDESYLPSPSEREKAEKLLAAIADKPVRTPTTTCRKATDTKRYNHG